MLPDLRDGWIDPIVPPFSGHGLPGAGNGAAVRVSFPVSFPDKEGHLGEDLDALLMQGGHQGGVLITTKHGCDPPVSKDLGDGLGLLSRKGLVFQREAIDGLHRLIRPLSAAILSQGSHYNYGEDGEQYHGDRRHNTSRLHYT